MDKSWLRFFAQKVKIDGESIRVGYDTVEGMVFTQEYGIPKNPNYIILGYIRPNGGCILDQLRKFILPLLACRFWRICKQRRMEV